MRTRIAVVCAALSALASCETVIGADFDDAQPRPQNIDMCDHAVPPDPPKISSGGADTSLIVVATYADFGEGELDDGRKAYLEVGYDVDGLCTIEGVTPKCRPAEYTGGDPTDGPRGIDNGVGNILSRQETYFGLKVVSSDLVNTNLESGKFAPIGIFEVRGFHGFSEDDEVQVTWHVPVAMELNPNGPKMPNLDGSDVWPLLTDGKPGDAAVRFESTEAYVTHSRLVARFEQARLPLANVYMQAIDAVVSGDIVYDPTSDVRRLVNGVVAGYCRADHLLEVIPRITTQFLSVPLCTDNPTYPSTKEFICSGADMATEAYVEGEPCDAITFGIGFTSEKTGLGDTVPLPAPKAGCSPATEPSLDTCVNPGPP